VDFALLAAEGSLLGLPHAYRDSRTAGAAERFYRRLSKARLYELTGLQELPFNTLFQLEAMVGDRSPLLDKAAALLFMPDLFNHLLTGRMVTEETIASTSQLYDTLAGGWSEEVIRALGVPAALFQEVVPPGTRLGALAGETAPAGLGGTPVYAAAAHDTASAVAAIPARGEGWAYISSGTWSLVGVELASPCRTPAARAGNFTNEGGLGGTTRFLRNVMGLWLLQECRRRWSREREWSYAELAAAAAAAPSFKALVDPDWPGFLNPPDMPAAVARFCRLTDQPVPAGPGGMTRALCEGLALKYALVLEEIGAVTGKPVDRVHLVGGGSRNELLCRFTAGALGLPVLAGPAEATGAGNLLVQAMGAGLVEGPAGVREAAVATFSPRRHEPREVESWARVREDFREICAVAERWEG